MVSLLPSTLFRFLCRFCNCSIYCCCCNAAAMAVPVCLLLPAVVWKTLTDVFALLHPISLQNTTVLLSSYDCCYSVTSWLQWQQQHYLDGSIAAGGIINLHIIRFGFRIQSTSVWFSGTSIFLLLLHILTKLHLLLWLSSSSSICCWINRITVHHYHCQRMSPTDNLSTGWDFCSSSIY